MSTQYQYGLFALKNESHLLVDSYGTTNTRQLKDPRNQGNEPVLEVAGHYRGLVRSVANMRLGQCFPDS
jgi:hypothetical protein